MIRAAPTINAAPTPESIINRPDVPQGAEGRKNQIIRGIEIFNLQEKCWQAYFCHIEQSGQATISRPKLCIDHGSADCDALKVGLRIGDMDLDILNGLIRGKNLHHNPCEGDRAYQISKYSNQQIVHILLLQPAQVLITMEFI